MKAFLRFYAARHRLETEQAVFRHYVADGLAAALTALGGQNVTRMRDILHPAPVDTRGPGEIVADITARAGLRVVKSDERIGLDSDAGT